MSETLQKWLFNFNKSTSTLVLLIVAIIVVIVFWNKVIPDQQFENRDYLTVFVENYVWFIYLIYGVFAWGVWQAIRLAADVDSESDEANRCKREFTNKLINYQNESMRQINALLPRDDNRKILKLYLNVYEAADNQRFESPYFAMQRCSDEFLEDANILSSIQRLGLQMGILGTFLGLITAFVKLYGQGKTLGGQEVSTDAIIEALSFSFGTSVAGLQCAIFLGIFSTVILRSKHTVLFDNISISANSLLYLCHKAQLTHKKAFDVNRLASSVSEQTKETHLQNIHLDALNRRMDDGLESLVQSKRELDEFIKKMVQDLTEIYGHFASERFSGEIEKSLSTVTQRVAERLNAHFDSVSSSFQNLGELDVIIAKINQRLEVTLAENNEMVAKSKTEIFQVLSEITTQLELVTGSSVRKELKSSIEQVGKEISIRNLEETRLVRKELGLLKEQLSTFNESFSAEVESRKPVKILLQIGDLSVQFVRSLLISIASLIRDLFKALFSQK